MSSVKTVAVVGLAFLLFAPAAHADPPNACADAYAHAQELRSKRQLLGARNALRVCAQQTCPSFIVKDCTTWLDEVQASLPSVVPVATDGAGNDLVGVKVSMDGQVLFESSDGRSVEVDPGRHSFTFELGAGAAEGTPPVVKQVVVAEGEKNKRIAVVLRRPGAAQATPPPLPFQPQQQVQPMQVQPLQPARPTVHVTVEANQDETRVQADSAETNTRRTCVAPCAVDLPVGNYTVGKARGDEPVRDTQFLYIGGPGTLKATHVSHRGLHVGGILLLIGSVLVQIGLSADAVSKKTNCDTFGGNCDTATNSSELGAATTIGILGFTAGIIMIAQKNRDDVTFVPLSVGPVGGPREGGSRIGTTSPQGAAVQFRF